MGSDWGGWLTPPFCPARAGARPAARIDSAAMAEQDSTPYVDAILSYAGRDPGRLHVPGHKGGPGADPRLRALAGDTALLHDVPALIEGIDVGPEPTPFQQAQRLAADAWGARRTWFLINGASQGNQAMCLALAHVGPRGGDPAKRPLLGDRRPHPLAACGPPSSRPSSTPSWGSPTA